MNQQNERVYSIDVLRGVAALSVVLYHWQHFFFSSGNIGDFNPSQQPFFEQFKILYKHGALGVELFFSISGFIFFWLYSDAISKSKTGGARFAVDRFSRLYPLHIATFLFVIVAQALYRTGHESYFVYQENDIYHAILNVLLVPAWGLEKGWSFNAPIWSVSVEVMLYGLFFISMKTGRARYFLTLALAIAGYALTPVNYKIGYGLQCFFAGGIAYLINEKLLSLLGKRFACSASAVFAASSWAVIAYSNDLNMLLLMCIAFPSTISLLFNLENLVKPVAKRISMIGDISYSVYLIHFPLQLAFAFSIEKLGIDSRFFYSKIMLLAYMLVLIPLCILSHRYFEVPAQKAIRNGFKRKSGATPVD